MLTWCVVSRTEIRYAVFGGTDHIWPLTGCSFSLCTMEKMVIEDGESVLGWGNNGNNLKRKGIFYQSHKEVQAQY